MTTDDLPELGPTSSDHLASILRALAGMVPWGGAALIEIISGVIPNQRSDRIEAFLLELCRRVSELEEGNGRLRLRQPESIDLLEDGAYQAARAMSDDRIKYISICVADGITKEYFDYLQSKRILRILNELDDAEIIYLAGRFTNWSNGWYSKHASILEKPDNEDGAAIFEAGHEHLIRLGLLCRHLPIGLVFK